MISDLNGSLGSRQFLKVANERTCFASCASTFFHDKEDDSNTSDKDIFETLQTRKSKWTPPEGQFASLDFFVNKCRHDINKLNFNRNTKFSNLSLEERVALKTLVSVKTSLSKRPTEAAL